MADVFLSYARVNSALAEQVAAALTDVELTVFLDVTVSVGESWSDRINEEIRSAKCVLTLWTRESISSQWVYSEAEYASQRGNLLSVRCDYEAPFPLYPFPVRLLNGSTVSWNTHSTDGLSEVVNATRKFIESRKHNAPI